MSGSLIVVGSMVVVGAIVTFVMYWASSDEVTRRAIGGVSLLPISEAKDGEKVRIVGRVEVDEPLRSPLSGRACACWRVVVRKERASTTGGAWKTLVDEHAAVDFRVVDRSGVALVRTSVMNPVLEKDRAVSSGLLTAPTEELRAFLEARNLETRGRLGNRTLSSREGVLEPGERVTVVGVGRWEADESGAKRLVLEGEEGSPVLLSDEPEMTAT